MKLIYIYGLHDEEGLIRYVGKTSHSLQARLGVHLYESRKCKRNYKCNWIRSMLRRGLVPTIRTICEVHSDVEANIKEREWIDSFRTWGVKLTNATDGGEGTVGWHHTIEARRKIRLAQKGKHFHNGMYGKHHSSVTRRKMSLAAKGRYHSIEERKKTSLAMKGKCWSAAACKAHADANRKKKEAKQNRRVG